MAKNTFNVTELSFEIIGTDFIIHGGTAPPADVEAACGQNTAHLVSSVTSTSALKKLKKDLLKALVTLEDL